MVRAPADRPDSERRLDRQRPQHLAARRAEREPRAEQACGVRVRRPCEQARGRPALGDAARVHDRDPVGDLRGDGEVVRDEEDPAAELVAQLFQQRQQLRLHRHVERGRRLVRDDQRRAADQGDRRHHALAQASRELVRIHAHAQLRVGDADRREQPDRLRLVARRLRDLRPTRIVGLSEVIGSWKITPSSPRRIVCWSAARPATMSTPAMRAEPSTIGCAAAGGAP